MRLAPEPGADRLHARNIDVNLAVHLDLEIAVAVLEQLTRDRRGLVRGLEREDAQDRHLVADLAAEQIVERHAERARLKVVQRAVDRAFGLIGAEERSIRLTQDSPYS